MAKIRSGKTAGRRWRAATDDPLAIVHCTDVRHHYQTTVRLTREHVDDSLKLSEGEQADRGWHERERWRRSLDRWPEQVGEWRRLRVEDKRYARGAVVKRAPRAASPERGVPRQLDLDR